MHAQWYPRRRSRFFPGLLGLSPKAPTGTGTWESEGASHRGAASAILAIEQVRVGFNNPLAVPDAVGKDLKPSTIDCLRQVLCVILTVWLQRAGQTWSPLTVADAGWGWQGTAQEAADRPTSVSALAPFRTPARAPGSILRLAETPDQGCSGPTMHTERPVQEDAPSEGPNGSRQVAY